MFGVSLALVLSSSTPFIIVGGVFAIFAYLIGLIVMVPSTRKVTSIMKTLQVDPDDQLSAELASTQKNFRLASLVELLFMFVAFSAMIAAGFL